MYNKDQLQLVIALAVALTLKILNKQQLDAIIAQLPQEIIEMVLDKVETGFNIQNYYLNYDSMVSLLTTGEELEWYNLIINLKTITMPPRKQQNIFTSSLSGNNVQNLTNKQRTKLKTYADEKV